MITHKASDQNEPSILQRIEKLREQFTDVYQSPPTVISRAPGRAEILGCHTDYNFGFALAAGISRSTLGFFSKRTDNNIHAASTAYPGEPVEFSLTHISCDEKNTWVNYVRAVVRELLQNGYHIGGANILIDSTVPKSGGVSSSAALELAVAFGLLALYKQKIDRTKIALACKTAENSDLVKSPCGFLDQGASAFAKDGAMVFFDFLPKGDSPVSSVRVVDAKLNPKEVSFVIPVDLTLERQLGETGYVARRKMCEDSLPFWSDVLHKEVKSLRDVALSDFLKFRSALEKKNQVMRKRVEHIIYENDRVMKALPALKNGDLATFGRLLTESGVSGLTLYGLDENTPQLTFLVTYGRTLPGVLGMRNMGGGFSAIALALVKKQAMKSFQKTLSEAYKKKFHRTLTYIEFSLTQGAEVLYA
ncbi:MAG TPA: galactokinase family protein [Patescibacteria group bacterium]|nr:galactokinase family protein [Patescibacteria group bacterium]